VAAGEIVLIRGSGFAPGVRVMFDGSVASLLYVSPDQLTAIVPETVDGRPSTTIEVVMGSERSKPLTLLVARSAPGIFTIAGRAPQSQAIALNEDGTLNSDSNPAAKGSLVTLFLTGAGRMITTGDARRPGLPVAVMVGGVRAPVVEASEFTDLAMNVVRVRIRVPDELHTSGSVPVTASVGAATSQTGVTIAVQ